MGEDHSFDKTVYTLSYRYLDDGNIIYAIDYKLLIFLYNVKENFNLHALVPERKYQVELIEQLIVEIGINFKTPSLLTYGLLFLFSKNLANTVIKEQFSLNGSNHYI